MSEYKGIKGFQVTTRTEDPTPYAQALADNPYGGAFSSGGNLNTARNALTSASHGSATSGLVFGGQAPSPTGATEEYDGSSWTESGDLNTARGRTSGGGTQTSAIAAGGYAPPGTQPSTEEYNGSSWTEIAEANSARYSGYGWGVNAEAVVIVAGSTSGPGSPFGESGLTEQWNGSAWTETGDLNTARIYLGGFGATYTAGIVAGGSTASGNDVGNAESFNGSSWTEVSDISTTRTQLAGYGTSNSDGYVVGGYNYGPNAGATQNEAWNGSAWTEVADLATARWDLSAGGSPSSGLVVGGDNPGGKQNATEEWTFSGLPPSTPAADYADAITGDFYYNSTTGQFKTVNTGGAPIGSWASGGALNTARMAMFNFGTQTAAIGVGGVVSPGNYKDLNENYNGTSWTEIAENNTARFSEGSVGSGTTTAGLIYSGSIPGGRSALTESWNGTAWTEVNDLNTARSNAGGGVGTQTASLLFGGQSAPGAPNYVKITESWDGSSWTEVNDLNTNHGGATGVGQVYTAALCSGGYTGTATTSTNEVWDGSSWTESGDLNTGRNNMMSRGGTATDGIIAGGYQSSGPSTGYKANTELFNGSTWTEIADLSTARYGLGGQGSTSSSSIAFGGNNPSDAMSNATEEFTAADFQIKTVTTS